MNNFENSALLMDCDGVIFDSNSLKTKAFEKALIKKCDDFELIKNFITYHKKNGGISRYEKFRLFITDFLKIEFDQKLYDYLLKVYGEICLELYEESDFTENLIEFLDVNSVPKFIVSGGDQKELQYVFKKRKIDSYFLEVNGSPETKNSIVSRIIKSRVCNNKEIFFIGDALEDLLVAKNNNLIPIFMKKYSDNRDLEHGFCKDTNTRVINTLKDLL
jgi:HAD superfamily hydrolase (TIGR01549 family)